jgi:hypothetical protein
MDIWSIGHGGPGDHGIMNLIEDEVHNIKVEV